MIRMMNYKLLKSNRGTRAENFVSKIFSLLFFFLRIMLKKDFDK